MKNLDNFNNIYASLAESAYNGRPSSFTDKHLNGEQKNKLNSGQSVPVDYTVDAQDPDPNDDQITKGGNYDPNDPNNDGIVYLQPDQDGLLEDESIGYNAYYLSENETINQDTHQTYFVVRDNMNYCDQR